MAGKNPPEQGWLRLRSAILLLLAVQKPPAGTCMRSVSKLRFD